MTNKTSNFTKERLLKIQSWSETYGPGSNIVLPAEEAEELARIALAAQQPELKPAFLGNKFYERYPLETFSGDGERAAALGYFLAGAELQCFGEFIKYEDLFCDE